MGITTTIPTNLDFPNRGILERDAFVLAQETAQDLLAGTYTTSLNQFAVEANQLEQNVTELESSTVASAALATSAANYKGEWVSTTNYLVGQSVSYNGGLYLAKTNNINQIPSSNTYWLLNSLQLPINSIDELKTVSNIASVNVLGYYTKGDGGGGLFYWDGASTEVDNGGIIIQATGVTTGRWKRVFSGAVNVKWFGAKGDGIADDTTALQNAFNYTFSNNIELNFITGIYLVTNINISSFGGNNYSNFRIIGNNSTIKGSSSLYTFKTHRVQGLNCDGLRITNVGGAAYATILDSFWFNNFANCDFGNTKLHADANWGVYWNEFNNCNFDNLYFDLTNYTINQNIWKGGRVGGISKSDATGSIKEAYNNVFIGVDMLGSIQWANPANEVQNSPLILRDCNLEFTGTNTGKMIIQGGRSNPQSNSVFFPYDNMGSEIDMVRSGSIASTGWKPYSFTNLFKGGACQTFNTESLTVSGMASGYLNIYSDASSPNGNNMVYRLYNTTASDGFLTIALPACYLQEAKNISSVSFSFWVYDVNANDTLLRYNTGGSDSYPTGYGSWSNGYKKCFINVPVSSNATQVKILIGGNNVAKDIRIAGISIVMGRLAIPYSPSLNEPNPNKSYCFKKTLIQNGTSQNTFSFIASGQKRIIIKAYTNGASSSGIYNAQLTTVYSSLNNTTSTNIVVLGVAGAGYGGSAGTVTSMTATTSGSTVTVSTTISNYSGTPNVDVNYELEFIDNPITITVL